MAKIRRDAIDYNLIDWSKPLSENAKIMRCSYTSLLSYAKKNGIAFVPGDVMLLGKNRTGRLLKLITGQVCE